MTPAVLTDHEDKVAFDFFQAKIQSKSMPAIDRDLAEKETELLKGKKVGYTPRRCLRTSRAAASRTPPSSSRSTPPARSERPKFCSTTRALS